MFDKKLYYNYIKILENLTIIIFMLYCIILALIGTFTFKLKGLIISIIIAFISGYPTYLFLKIKVEEMKWKLDIYNKINTEEKESL